MSVFKYTIFNTSRKYVWLEFHIPYLPLAKIYLKIMQDAQRQAHHIFPLSISISRIQTTIFFNQTPNDLKGTQTSQSLFHIVNKWVILCFFVYEH
jgi:hypothetical protein